MGNAMVTTAATRTAASLVGATIKRADYFAASTLVVWGVDLLEADIIRSYHSATPDAPSSE